MNRVRPVKVLVVEDEFLVLVTISDALADYGFEVRAVSTAEEALAEIESGEADVLFTDVNLPGGMDGTELAVHARELVPDLPVVYASAVWPRLEEGRKVPGSAFLPKPYDPAEACRVIARMAASVH
jgi:CheY-like chemotaxis protein